MGERVIWAPLFHIISSVFGACFISIILTITSAGTTTPTTPSVCFQGRSRYAKAGERDMHEIRQKSELN